MSEPSTYLVRRLDDPWMVAFVEMDVAVIAGMVFFFIGVIFTMYLFGGLAAFVAARYYQKLKVGKPRGAAKHWVYWNLPRFVLPLKATPPSYYASMYG